jgi:hypothetical protein
MKTNRPFRLIVVFSLLALIALFIMLYNQNLENNATKQAEPANIELTKPDSI